jgi:hypothetical protein
MADVGVLTVDAAQVAPRKEDRPRPAPAAEGILLAEMGAIAVNDGARAGPADGAVNGSVAIDVAIACAEVAVPEPLLGSFDPTLQLAALE